jgi:hypothetical protein
VIDGFGTADDPKASEGNRSAVEWHAEHYREARVAADRSGRFSTRLRRAPLRSESDISGRRFNRMIGS